MAAGARNERRPTLRDVAAASGVSLQTVSNVINNPHRVAPQTLQRVTADIARLGFRPNTAARQLRTRRTDALGIEIPGVRGRGFGTIHDTFLSALTAAAQEDETRLIPFVVETSDILNHYDQLLATRIVDGFVLTDTHIADPRPSWLRDRGVPFVSFGRIWDDPSVTAWVDVDGAAGTTAAVEHLVDQGYERIAFLGWPEGSSVGDDRRRGWVQACANSGRATDLVAITPQDVTAAQRATRSLLDELQPGDAIVCVSDAVALGALTELATWGLRPGKDIGIVGFDDCDFASVFGLTTVRQPVGRIAAHMISRLRSEETQAQGTVIRPTLIPRSTTTRR